MAPYLEQIAAILPMFLVLECIVLSSMYYTRAIYSTAIVSWEEDLPQSFRKAVEDCLRTPTLQEVHVGFSGFPLSILDGHANINCFSLCGVPQIPEFADATYPQLKSLSVDRCYEQDHRTFSSTWAIQHIAKLQSLKYDYSSNATISGLLEICSDTLHNLDLSLVLPVDEFDITYNYRLSKRGNYRPDDIPLSINLLSLPHLQHLTIRAEIYLMCGNRTGGIELCSSFLPAAVKILDTAPSLQRLTIEINVYFPLGCDKSNCDGPTPITALAESPVSFHDIDLHFNCNQDLYYAEIVSSLADYEGLTRLMEQGVLVIHVGEAPSFLDTGSKSTLVQYPRV